MVEIVQSVFRGDHASLKNKIPIREKLSAENYALEREKIFRRAWLCVAHALDLPEPGSYRVVDVPTFKTSLLLCRGDDGVVRGFHNICRHRGNKLVRTGAGNRIHFACGFHGWVFSNTGELKLVTDEPQFLGIDKRELGLIPVTTEVWQGLVFVNFDATPQCSLREWIGEMYGQFDGYFDDKEKHTAYEVEVKCNWHLAVTAFIEGYHTAYLHRNTAPDYQGGKINPNRHRPLIETFTRHQRYSAPRNPDHRQTPAEAAIYKHGRLLAPAFDGVNDGLPPGVNPLRSNTWAFDVVEMFPNFLMLNSNYWHLGIWYWPVDEGRTVIRAERIFTKARNPGDRLGQAFSKVRAREVLREDLNTLEATQEMLESGVMEHIHLSQQELALQHHFRMTDDMLAG
jgi:phenylpropionate dioxygenase-like ring-hydroxylating dioxygenase large terminal subunit